MKAMYPAPTPRPRMPQCAAKRTEPYANDGYGTNYRCKRMGRYEHKGRIYCAQHAGRIALALWVQGKLVRK